MFSGNNHHKYSAISDPEISHDERDTAEQRASARRFLKYAMVGVGATILLMFTMSWESDSPMRCERTANCTDTSTHLWGQYSPVFSVPSKISSDIPEGCEVTFASVLSRHGARDPTASKSKIYQDLIERIQNSVTHYDHGFEFIKDVEYKLGADQLTEFGVQQMIDSGTTFFERYPKLAKNSDPFIRAAGSQRVIESATNFTKGFYASRREDSGDAGRDVLVVPEEEGYNNTLNHGACTAFEEGPAADIRQRKQAAWKNIWVPPIAARLNHKLRGANLTFDDTIYMMDLCPFHVVASPEAKRSAFCNLFNQDEWRSYDYFMSLDKWYGYGQGNPLGPTQGVGYVNELIARLTMKPVEDETSTNQTLNDSDETFPLDRKLYADFSHDNLMASVHAAMGLYNDTKRGDLPVGWKVAPGDNGGFSAAWTVPFAGRMYVEKMRCESRGKEELVRVVVNERVVSLRGCEADEEGRCEVGKFVESLAFARHGGRWDECFS